MNRSASSLLLTACLLVAGLTTAQQAQAIPGPRGAGEEQVQILKRVAPEALRDTATQVPTASGKAALRVVKEGAEATVATDPAVPVAFNGPGGEMGLKLPFADTAADAIETGVSGTVSFDNKNGSFTVPIAKSDASIQITTIISNPAAPTRYDYDFSIPEGGTIEQLGTGAVLIRDNAGFFIAAVNPAWAKDTNGNSVPTHYEVEGRTLSQIVTHSSGMAYPIVADPWVGTLYFDSISQDTWNGQPAVHIVPSGFSRMLEASGNGWQVREFGWMQLKQVWPEVTTKPTYEQQYKCHAEFALVPWIGGNTWDLEKARANLGNWYIGALQHRCNW